MTHNKLIEVGYNWILKETSCGVAFKEPGAAREVPDVVGFGHCQSIILEAKITRSDFLKDKKKIHRSGDEKGMGMFRFYIVPGGLISIDELPDHWGLIEVYEDGTATAIYNPYGKGNTWTSPTVASYTFDRNIEAEWRVMYSALRRIEQEESIKKFLN